MMKTEALTRRGSTIRAAIPCPTCQHPLTRINRRRWQRWLSLILPVQRYHCDNCYWKGLRFRHK